MGPLRPVIGRLAPLVSPALAAVAPAVRQAAAAVNASLAGLEAWQLVALTVLATLLLGQLLRGLQRALRTVQDKGARLPGCAMHLHWRPGSCFSAPTAGFSSTMHCHSCCAAGVKQVVAGTLLDLPGVRGQVQRKQEELREKIREDLRKKSAQSEREGGCFCAAVS